MTSKLFKRIALLVLFLMSLSILAACGDSPTNTPAATTAAATTAATATTAAPAATTAATTAAATATTAAPAATTATTGGAMALPKVTGSLTIWHAYGSGGTGEGKALEDALKLFRADNPDAKLEVLDVPFDQLFNKFKTEAAAGGGPDLFIAPNDSLGDLVRAKLLLDVTSKLSGKLENALPVSVDGSKVDGKLYAVPESLKAVAMFYNKATVKEVPKTTDDLLKLAKAGTKIGFNNNPYHQYGFFGGFGGKLLDPSGKAIADQGGFAEAVQWMKDMKAAGVQFFTDGEKFNQAFQTKQLDIVVEGPWKTADFKKALAADLGVAPIPAGPKGPATPLTGVDGWYINANTKNADNAVNFALYMTSPKVEQIFVDQAGHIPADKTLKISDPITQEFAKAVATGFPRPQVPELSAYWENFGNALSLAIDKGEDAKKVVADATAAMNKANKK